MDELVKKGSLRLHWAYDHMPVIQEIDKRFRKEQPLAGLKIGMALHTEAKTGMLAVTLANAGAEIRLASCNPLSTDDSVAAALREEFGLKVYAKKFESDEEYYANLNSVLDMKPDFVIDDGADLITMAHTSRREVLSNIKGGNEETTTGIVRLKAMAADKKLEFPVMDVNDSKMKYLFDNRYGTGQSVFDGWMNATNLIVAGKRVVVAGYGWCGKGVEARMDGFDVMPMKEAVKTADIVLTVTGCKDIVTKQDFLNMKDGCVLGNAGHFDNEVSKKDLNELAVSKTQVRDFVDCYTLKDGRRIYLIGEGRLMNLAAGQGHPAEIMDTSFSTQAMAIVYMVENHDKLSNNVIPVPDEIDNELAMIKLRSLGIEIDTLTEEQYNYIHSWQEGT